MSSHAAAGRHYTLDVGPPPFLNHPGIRCGEHTANLFFGPDREAATARRLREERAKAICAGCPVRAACDQWATDTGQVGLWGGRTDKERCQPSPAPVVVGPLPPVPERCGNGHLLDDANVYYKPSRPSQWNCRACAREAVNRSAARRRAAAREARNATPGEVAA